MAQCVYGTFEVIIIRILEPSIVDFVSIIISDLSFKHLSHDYFLFLPVYSLNLTIFRMHQDLTVLTYLVLPMLVAFPCKQ